MLLYLHIRLAVMPLKWHRKILQTGIAYWKLKKNDQTLSIERLHPSISLGIFSYLLIIVPKLKPERTYLGSDSPLLFGTEIVFRAPRWQARVGGKKPSKGVLLTCLFVPTGSQLLIQLPLASHPLMKTKLNQGSIQQQMGKIAYPWLLLLLMWRTKKRKEKTRRALCK